MKTTQLNTIINTQNAEVEAKAKAEKLAKEKELLDAAQPKTVIDMIHDIENGIASFVTDDNDNIVGFGYHPHAKGMNVVKQNGQTMTVGSTEEERAQDEFDVKMFIKQYGSLDRGARIMQIAVSLINADLLPDEEVEHKGHYYFIILNLKKVIKDDGTTIVDLSEDIPGEIDSALLTTILKDKLTIALQK